MTLPVWVALAVGAAFLQNLRSALQKAVTARLAVLGATYARFLFAVPWAVLAAVILIGADPAGMPGMSTGFVLWGILRAGAQVAAQVLLLRLFTFRNFAVGNAFARSETVQAALIGAVLIGDRLAPLPALGILVSLFGVLVLTANGGLRGGFDLRAAGIGIASGTAFALAGVAYRAASLGLEGDAGFLARAALTLAFVTLVQTLAMTLWMLARAPGSIAAVLRAWRVTALVGVVGMLASFGWFAAFTLAPAAEVKAVGQIELLFSLATARLAFGERPSRRELLGILLLVGGILLLVLGT